MLCRRDERLSCRRFAGSPCRHGEGLLCRRLAGLLRGHGKRLLSRYFAGKRYRHSARLRCRHFAGLLWIYYHRRFRKDFDVEQFAEEMGSSSTCSRSREHLSEDSAQSGPELGRGRMEDASAPAALLQQQLRRSAGNSQPKPTKAALVTNHFNKIEEKNKIKCKIVSDSYLKYLCPYNHFGEFAESKSNVTKVADRSSVASS